jgi:hypothetical protein
MGSEHTAGSQHDAYLLLLQNIQTSITDMSDVQQDVLQRVSRIEESNKQILGNGKPGRLGELEATVKSQVAYANRFKGALYVICGILTLGAGALGKVAWDVMLLIQMHQPLPH